MTKQQPCASKLRLSKICRWLIALGVAKSALFGAWAVDMPLPSLFEGTRQASTLPLPAAPVEEKTAAGLRSSADADAPVPFVAVATPRSGMEAPVSTPEPIALVTPESTTRPEAASAAPLPKLPALHLPWTKAALEQAENESFPLLRSGVDGEGAARVSNSEEEAGWWTEILNLTKLPVPLLGARQIAHAATMDTPPPPAPPRSAGTSPFAPREQTQAAGGAPPAAPGMSPTASSGRNDPPLPLRPQNESGRPVMPTVPADPGSRISAPPVPNVRSPLSAESPDRKQQELARREQEVLMLKQQMESRLQELQSTEKKVQGMLKEAYGIHDQKLKHLISSYTNMKAKQAAQALESLDERLAVRILAGMNPKQAGEVLTYTDPKVVAKLTELLARMQLPENN